MIDLPPRISPLEVIQLTRILRSQKVNSEEAGPDLARLLAELDRLGFDAVLTVRRKRGRPSNVSRFLSRQNCFDFKAGGK